MKKSTESIEKEQVDSSMRDQLHCSLDQAQMESNRGSNMRTQDSSMDPVEMGKSAPPASRYMHEPRSTAKSS